MAFVGSTVTLRDTEDDSTEVYKLVGEVSGVLDLDSDVIEVSMGSPIGQALTKARVGDIVLVDLPRGSRRFEVIALA
jgi:transcription elongation factor GreA